MKSLFTFIMCSAYIISMHLLVVHTKVVDVLTEKCGVNNFGCKQDVQLDIVILYDRKVRDQKCIHRGLKMLKLHVAVHYPNSRFALVTYGDLHECPTDPMLCATVDVEFTTDTDKIAKRIRSYEYTTIDNWRYRYMTDVEAGFVVASRDVDWKPFTNRLKIKRIILLVSERDLSVNSPACSLLKPYIHLDKYQCRENAKVDSYTEYSVNEKRILVVPASVINPFMLPGHEDELAWSCSRWSHGSMDTIRNYVRPIDEVAYLCPYTWHKSNKMARETEILLYLDRLAITGAKYPISTLSKILALAGTNLEATGTTLKIGSRFWNDNAETHLQFFKSLVDQGKIINLLKTDESVLSQGMTEEHFHSIVSGISWNKPDMKDTVKRGIIVVTDDPTRMCRSSDGFFNSSCSSSFLKDSQAKLIFLDISNNTENGKYYEEFRRSNPAEIHVAYVNLKDERSSLAAVSREFSRIALSCPTQKKDDLDLHSKCEGDVTLVVESDSTVNFVVRSLQLIELSVATHYDALRWSVVSIKKAQSCLQGEAGNKCAQVVTGFTKNWSKVINSVKKIEEYKTDDETDLDASYCSEDGCQLEWNTDTSSKKIVFAFMPRANFGTLIPKSCEEWTFSCIKNNTLVTMLNARSKTYIAMLKGFENKETMRFSNLTESLGMYEQHYEAARIAISLHRILLNQCFNVKGNRCSETEMDVVLVYDRGFYEPGYNVIVAEMIDRLRRYLRYKYPKVRLSVNSHNDIVDSCGKIISCTNFVQSSKLEDDIFRTFYTPDIHSHDVYVLGAMYRAATEYQWNPRADAKLMIIHAGSGVNPPIQPETCHSNVPSARCAADVTGEKISSVLKEKKISPLLFLGTAIETSTSRRQLDAYEALFKKYEINGYVAEILSDTVATLDYFMRIANVNCQPVPLKSTTITSTDPTLMPERKADTYTGVRLKPGVKPEPAIALL